jgi:uncharacterized membrane protein SpoIIM required for sporulation
MTAFEIVAIILVGFLGFGIVMGVLIVSVFSRGRATRYLEDRNRQLPEDDRPSRWPGS